jgi:hypothetical protein
MRSVDGIHGNEIRDASAENTDGKRLLNPGAHGRERVWVIDRLPAGAAHTETCGAEQIVATPTTPIVASARLRYEVSFDAWWGLVRSKQSFVRVLASLHDGTLYWAERGGVVHGDAASTPEMQP